MLGWLNRNNSAINGLTGAEYNLLDPSNPASTKVYVTDQVRGLAMRAPVTAAHGAPPPPPPPR